MTEKRAPYMKRLDDRGGFWGITQDGWAEVNFIETTAHQVRGNHYHKIKREYVYVLSGNVLLVLEDLETRARETLELTTGNLVLIPPGIVHALQVKESGMAVEFSADRFDASDTYRSQLV